MHTRSRTLPALPSAILVLALAVTCSLWTPAQAHACTNAVVDHMAIHTWNNGSTAVVRVNAIVYGATSVRVQYKVGSVTKTKYYYGSVNVNDTVTFPNTPAGTQTVQVTVTPRSGFTTCSSKAQTQFSTVSIPVPASISVSMDCDGPFSGNDFFCTANVSGGSGNYSYQWSTSASVQYSQIFSNNALWVLNSCYGSFMVSVKVTDTSTGATKTVYDYPNC